MIKSRQQKSKMILMIQNEKSKNGYIRKDISQGLWKLERFVC